MRTLVIGDVHGEHSMLARLLEKADVGPDDVLVQLGDLLNVVRDSVPKDEKTLTLAEENGIHLLVGNHEAALLKGWPRFSGSHFDLKLAQKYKALIASKQVTLACVVGKTLITHAGLHPAFAPKENVQPKTFVRRLGSPKSREPFEFVRAISSMRGGFRPYGGILWRDEREWLFSGYSQVFGHTALSKEPRVYQNALAIDTGCSGRVCGPLTGVWLDEEGEFMEFVSVPWEAYQ